MTTNDDPDVRRETIAYDAAGIRLTPDLPPRPVNTPHSAQETAQRAVETNRQPCPICEGAGYTDALIDDRCGRCGTTGFVDAPAVDPLREALAWLDAELHEHGYYPDGPMRSRARAALAAAPQPAPVGREALADLITDAELRWQSKGPHTGPTKSLAIADALLAAGLRLPGAEDARIGHIMAMAKEADEKGLWRTETLTMPGAAQTAEIDRLTAALAEAEALLSVEATAGSSLADEVVRLEDAMAEAEDRGAAQMRERAAEAVLYLARMKGMGERTIDAPEAAHLIRALPLREPGAAP